MASRLTGTLGMPAITTAGPGGAGVVSALASTLTGFIQHATRALTGRNRTRAIARVRRGGHGDWESAAQEQYLKHAVDFHDLEHRQRAWDRDEASAYRMSGWK